MTFVMTLMAAPAQLGWQIPLGQHILKLSASPDDPSCKKAGLGYTLGIGQHGRNWIAEKLYVDNVPHAVMAREFEQTFVGPDMEPLRHLSSHYPPDSA